MRAFDLRFSTKRKKIELFKITASTLLFFEAGECMLGIPKGEICLMPKGDINCDTIQKSGERI